MNRSRLVRRLRPVLEDRPALKRALRGLDESLARWKHTLAGRFPALVRPEPRQLTVAITAACNLRCIGCRYGRDFMVGERLSLDLVRTLLDDAAEAGVNRVRLFGGEPLLHRDLPAMIRHSTGLGMDTYITTNGTRLAEHVDELHDAGLRWLTLGFYGTGAAFGAYTQRPDQFEAFERGVATVRERHGHAIEMQLNYVLVRPTTSLAALREAWAFARRYELYFHLDLYGYSVPFFTDGPDREVAFTEADRPVVEAVTAELVRLQREHPEVFPHSAAFLRSVTDWLLLGADMRVPCDASQLIWVGADGSVQLCDVHFPLGNLHETRLRDVLFGAAHRQACRDAFQLRCPNCTCKADSRIRKHAASLRRYRG